jgi:TM2 domain-containing membrane protein YozV
VSVLSAQTNLFQLRSELQKPAEHSNAIFQEQAFQAEKKSPAKAVLYSLLLPGMGELYVNRFDQGKYSLIAEGGLWLTYISFLQYGAWIRDDARRFSATHAGAQIEGKSDQYFVDVGNFNDTYEYNEKKLTDRTSERLYDVNAGYYWKWDTDENRSTFRAMRVSHEKVFNNSKFVVGAIIVNHILSAVNAARLTRQYNAGLEEGLGSWWLESSLYNNGVTPDGIKFSVVHRF